jgi:glycosyltransferase involved in cell wall biosynthesis
MNAAQPRLTVLTASFNRAHLLQRLHHSLQSQPVAPGLVEWLIIDDGSTDGTADKIAELRALGGPVDLQCIAMPHGGKHRALNEGFALAKAPWILVVDSDDWFCPDALPLTVLETEKAEAQGAFAVIAPLIVPRAQRQFRFARPDRAVTFAERTNQEPPFDCSLIFRRDTPGLRFPEFPQEDFLAEAALLFDLGRAGRVWLSDKVLVCAEYQPDGLSAQIRRKRMHSPLGACYAYQTMLACPLALRLRPRLLANFARFWWHARLSGRTPPRPRSLGQAMVLSFGWIFCLADHLVEARRP